LRRKSITLLNWVLDYIDIGHLFTVEELAVSEPGLADVIKLFAGSLCFLKVGTFLDYLVKFGES